MAGTTSCSACPLRDRKRVDFVGPVDAKLCLIGEAPGANEVRMGEPFVGPSGILLDGVLKALDIDRNALRIGNVLLCGPISEQDRKEDWWFEDALRCCRDRREAANDVGSTSVVVALGATAAQGVLERRIVLGGRHPRRGALHKDAKGRSVFPTWHPAAILRAGGADTKSGLSDAELETLGHDLRKACCLAQGRARPFYFDPDICLTGDPDMFVEWCLGVWHGATLALDVETTSVDPLTCKMTAVGLADENLSVSAVSFWWPNANDAARSALRGLLADESLTKVFHNAQFDMTVLQRLVGSVRGRVCDTLLMSHALYPDCRVDLGSVAHTWLIVPPWKAEFYEREARRHYKTWTDEQRVEDLLRYNALDAAATYALADPLLEECRREEVIQAADLDTRLALVARGMTEYGVPVDDAARNALRLETQAYADAACSDMERLLVQAVAAATDDPLTEAFLCEVQRVGRWNPNSPDSMRAAFDLCGVKVPAGRGSLTPTGQRSVSKTAIAAVGDHPFVAAVSSWRQAQNLLSRFFAPDSLDLDAAGRLHVPWKIHGTPTGRWASGGSDDDSSARSTNMQNWPKAMRRMVIAPPGNVFVGADYKALELRAIALLAGEQTLLDVFNDPAEPDLHTMNAARLYAGPAWLSTDPERAADEDERLLRKKKRGILRRLTKTGIYGAMYLATVDTLQMNLRTQSLKEKDAEFAAILRQIDKKQCRLFVEAIPKLWPRIGAWREHVQKQVPKDCFWRSPLSGRRRVWPTGQVDAAQCVNTPVQMLAADIMNDQFLRLAGRLPQEAHIVLQVHDSVVIECPEATAAQVGELMSSELTTTVQLNGFKCVFPVECDVGTSWDAV